MKEDPKEVEEAEDDESEDTPLRRTISLRFAAILFLAAFGVRLAYWAETRDAELVLHPVGWAAFYDALARGLPVGASPGGTPSPLYALFVMALGDLTVFAQFALGSATAVLVAHIAAIAVIPRVGVIAGVIAALHPPAFHAEGLLGPAALAAFLVAAALVLAQRAMEAPSASTMSRTFVLFGAASGLAFLCRPDAAAVFVAILAGGLPFLFRFRSRPRVERSRVLVSAGLALATFLVIAAGGAVVARDLPSGSMFAHGVPAESPPRAAGERFSLLVSGKETSDAPPQYAAMDRESVVKRLLSPALDYRAIAPLAVVALPLASGYFARGAAPLYLALAAHVAFVLFFRAIPPLPLAAAPAFFAFAAYSIVGFLQCLRSTKTHARALGIAASAALLAFGFGAPRERDAAAEAATFAALGEVRAARGDTDGAVRAFQAAADAYRAAGDAARADAASERRRAVE